MYSHVPPPNILLTPFQYLKYPLQYPWYPMYSPALQYLKYLHFTHKAQHFSTSEVHKVQEKHHLQSPQSPADLQSLMLKNSCSAKSYNKTQQSLRLPLHLPPGHLFRDVNACPSRTLGNQLDVPIFASWVWRFKLEPFMALNMLARYSCIPTRICEDVRRISRGLYRIFRRVCRIFGEVNRMFGGVQRIFGGVRRIFGGVHRIFGGVHRIFEGVGRVLWGGNWIPLDAEHVLHEDLKRSWVIWSSVADSQFVFASVTAWAAERTLHKRVGK